jgi:arylesterase/paraoxonase
MKILKWASGILVTAIVGLGIYIVWGQGLFITVQDEFDGTCTAIAGAPGSEDLTIDQEFGIVYFSSMDRVAQAQGLVDQGAILALDLNAPATPLINLTDGLGLGLVPHGISLWKNPTDQPDRLFVINHFNGRHSVEIFEIVGQSLVHVLTVRGGAMVSPNDLVAVDATRFMATNDSRWTDPQKGLMEKLLRLPVANVVYYDGIRFTEVVGSTTFPNGINMKADGQQMYLATMGNGEVLIFDRDPATGGFSTPVLVDVPGQPDNIEIAPDGSLLVGLHAKTAMLLTSMLDPDAVIPSRIVRIDPLTHEVSIVYDNSGTEISAASVAAIHGNKLVIGAIADPDILVCELP